MEVCWFRVRREPERRTRMSVGVRRFAFSGVALVLVALAVALFSVTAAHAKGAGGVTGPAFYVNGEAYRTVGTPTDLSNTGAPAHSFDVIYDLGGAQLNVAG